MIEVISYHLIGVLFGIFGFRDLHFCMYRSHRPLVTVMMLVGSLGQIICSLIIVVGSIHLGLYGVINSDKPVRYK